MLGVVSDYVIVEANLLICEYGIIIAAEETETLSKKISSSLSTLYIKDIHNFLPHQKTKLSLSSAVAFSEI